MATVSRKTEKGGFDCDFVEQPPSTIQSECPVCLQILCEPYQAPCCGNSFCRVCIEKIKTDNKPCPTCKEDNFVTFFDKRLQRSLYGFQVYCSHKQEGCEWKGELGQLDNHLNLSPQADKQLEGCEYSEIECIYCSELIKRCNIAFHQSDLCPKRPFSCEYCHSYESHYEDVINSHWPVCGYHPVQCPNECGTFPQRQALQNHITRDSPKTFIDCDFHHVGCDVRLPRKDMPAHLNENLVTHMSLQAASYNKLLASHNELQASHSTLQASHATLQASHATLQTSHTVLTRTHSIRNFFSKEIKFYNRDDPYYEFTNFYPSTVIIDGVKWPTTEHYFQAQKFVGTPYVELIRNLHAPQQAFQMSRDPKVSHWRRSDWDSVKDDVMHKALQCKFDQHPNLRNKLLETGNKKMIEHTSNDSYWGDGGGEGRGLNKLGQLLMKVREEMKAKYGSHKRKSDGHVTFEQLESTLIPGETSRSVRGMASPMTSLKDYSQQQQPIKRSSLFTSGVFPSSTDHTFTNHATSGRPRDDTTVTSNSYRPSQVSSSHSSHMTSHFSHMAPLSSHMTLQSNHKTSHSTQTTSKQGHKQPSSSRDDSTLKQGEKTPGKARLRRTSSLGNLRDTSKSSAGSHKGRSPRPLPSQTSSSASKWGHGTPPKQSKPSLKQPTLRETLQKFTPSSRSSSSSSQSGKRKTNDSSVKYDILTHQHYKTTQV